MKATKAIKTYLESGSNGMPVKVSELRELKSVSSDEEWSDYGRVACELMGETFEK